MAAPIIHIELRSSDFGRTATFYSKIFDWQTQQNASATYMKLDAAADAGGGPSAGWVRTEMTQAPAPLAYVAVDDLAAKLAEIESAGGRIIVASMPFAGGGEIGLFADPDGNVVGLWMRKDRPAAAGAKPAAKAAAAPAPAAAAPAAPASKTAAPTAATKAGAAAKGAGDKKPKKR